MDFNEYSEVLKNGERVDWHGEMVPHVLITSRVHTIANMILLSLSKFENDISELRNGTKERLSKERYFDSVMQNVKHLPYTSNGLINDSYMVKYKKIISEIEKEKEEKVKPKVRKTRKPKVNKEEEKETTNSPVVKKRGKNSNLIFGK